MVEACITECRILCVAFSGIPGFTSLLVAFEEDDLMCDEYTHLRRLSRSDYCLERMDGKEGKAISQCLI